MSYKKNRRRIEKKVKKIVKKFGSFKKRCIFVPDNNNKKQLL